ncbi:hypothetical protein LC040_02145 [Bacillus tianshenii]|nr:hypothetical protein LC040_02145 [Bacillus tianshenii]
MTVEEGYLDKESYSVQVNEDNSIQAIYVMLSINSAKRLWKINIAILPVFIAGFFTLLERPKYFKRLAGLYFLCLIGFILWDINQNQGVLEEVVENVGYFGI